MKAVRVAALVVVVFVVQVVLLSHTRIFGAHVDLLFIFALAAGITGGRKRGAWAGFGAGLVSDAFLTSPLGLSALVYAMACYGVGAFAEHISGAPWVVALVALAGAFGGAALYVIFGNLIGAVHTGGGHALSVISIEALSAAVVGPAAAWALKNAWQERVEAW